MLRYSILSALCAFVASSPSTDRCKLSLKEAGVSDHFASSVAHGIHSMTVDELKKYESTVTIKNRVPTVNRDLNSPDALLTYAPEYGRKYVSDVMNAINEVFERLDDESYMFHYSTALELVAHEAHMHEHWANIRLEYEKLRSHPLSDEMCACVMDIEKNGIMTVLRNAAAIFRDPQLVLGVDPRNLTKGELRYGMLRMRSGIMYREKVTPDSLWKRSHYGLTGREAWRYHMQADDVPTHEDFYDAALFLHCALKEEHVAARNM